MWKCVSKSLKGILDKSRHKCWNIPTTTVTQNRKCDCSILRLSPAIVERLTRYYGFGESVSSENTSKDKHHKDRKAKTGFCFDGLQLNWFQTLKNWSVIVVGLYFIYPFGLKNKSYITDLEVESLSKITKNWKNDLHLLISNANLGVPTVYSYPVSIESHVDKSDAAASFGAGSSKNQVENSDNLEKAHAAVISVMKNLYGTEQAKINNHKQAFDYFKEAADENNAAALFNLAVCHEMGLGTSQDFIKAAELYRKASSLGHPTAMYNLGIFHAHGWGGVEQSASRARELFQAAANLGQIDARNLLHMDDEESHESENGKDLKKNTCNVQDEPEYSQQSSSTSTDRYLAMSSDTASFLESSENLKKNYLKESENRDSFRMWYQTLGRAMEDSEVGENSHKKIEQLSSVDSGVLEMSSEDALDIVFA